MTRSDQDERFEVSEISRRGAHRARPNPLTGLLPLLALAVVVVGVVGLAYVFFGRGASTTSTTSGAVASAGGSTPSSLPSISAAASPGTATATSSAQPGGTASAAPVDKTLTLNFYNGTSPNVRGLSRTASEKLAAKGWKIGTVETWTGPAVTRTTVYYGSPDQLSTARAVVKVLGGGTVKLNTVHAAQGLAVVISNDYTP